MQKQYIISESTLKSLIAIGFNEGCIFRGRDKTTDIEEFKKERNIAMEKAIESSFNLISYPEYKG
jgi:hypothetical protein